MFVCIYPEVLCMHCCIHIWVCVGVCVYACMHADDICLLAPSALGLQKLSKICYGLSQDNEIFLVICNLYMLFLDQKDIVYWPGYFTVRPPPSPPS